MLGAVVRAVPLCANQPAATTSGAREVWQDRDRGRESCYGAGPPNDRIGLFLSHVRLRVALRSTSRSRHWAYTLRGGHHPQAPPPPDTDRTSSTRRAAAGSPTQHTTIAQHVLRVDATPRATPLRRMEHACMAAQTRNPTMTEGVRGPLPTTAARKPSDHRATLTILIAMRLRSTRKCISTCNSPAAATFPSRECVTAHA